MAGERAGDVADVLVAWSLLGPDTALLDGSPAELAPRPRAVLLRLLLEPNQVVTSDQLADAIWGEHPPRTASNSVARFVADVRQALGPASRVVTADRGYRVEVRVGELDVETAQAALLEATRRTVDDPTGAVALVARGLACFAGWPNRALADLHHTAAAARGHEEVLVGLREALGDLRLELGQHKDAVGELEAAVAEHPLHERFWAQLMLALYRAGRPAEALEAYQRLRTATAELGLEPSPPLRQLEAEVLSHDVPSAPPARGSDAAHPVTAGQLRMAEPRTSFVGREEEVEQVRRTLEDHRLVSIVGLGGSGKSRVALEVARQAEVRGATVHRVGLPSVSDPSLVVPSIAAVIGIPSDKTTLEPEVLAAQLRPQSMLVVLDRCEHLVEACADVAEALLDAAPDVQVLATSREPLGVEGEQVLRLGGLETIGGCGEASGPAVELFETRMESSADQPDDARRRAITEICRQLGGLPLAIELAAAQTAYLGPADLLDRMSEPLLGAPSGEPSAPSLQSVLDWAWEGLTPPQRELLARISVFGGGGTLEAVEVVCGGSQPIMADLVALVDRSLVTVMTVDGRTHYQMLDAVRVFASDRLEESGSAGAIRDRLVGWLQELLDRWKMAELYARADAIEQVAPEHDSLVAALDHLRAEGRTEELVWLAVRATGMWVHRGLGDEALRWIGASVQDESLSLPARSAAAAALAEVANAAGDVGVFVSNGVRAVELAEGRPHDWIPNVAGMLAVASLVFVVPFTEDELVALAVTAAGASPSRDDNLAMVAVWRGHLQFAKREYEQAVDHFRVAQTHSRHRGRALLNSEVGEALALYMAGRREEAAAVVADSQSDPATDVWHYLADVVRAIVFGGAGRPEEATEQLAAAVRALPSGTVWGRADDFQTAFGLLASFRGEQELSDQLLATPVSRHPLIAIVLIEHVAQSLGRSGEDEWRLTAMELFTRLTDPEGGRGAAGGTLELVEWWAEGAQGLDRPPGT